MNLYSTYSVLTMTTSFQVLLKEKREVLIRWLMDRSVNWSTKSSQLILRVKTGRWVAFFTWWAIASLYLKTSYSPFSLLALTGYATAQLPPPPFLFAKEGSIRAVAWSREKAQVPTGVELIHKIFPAYPERDVQKFNRRWTIIALRNLIFYWSNIELTWHECSFMSPITNYKEKMLKTIFWDLI